MYPFKKIILVVSPFPQGLWHSGPWAFVTRFIVPGLNSAQKAVVMPTAVMPLLHRKYILSSGSALQHAGSTTR